MNNVDMLSHEDLSDEREWVPEGEESYIALHDWEMRQMVDFHTVGHVSDTSSVTLEFVSDEAHFVTSLNKALG
jgi:hypothetical protein